MNYREQYGKVTLSYNINQGAYTEPRTATHPSECELVEVALLVDDRIVHPSDIGLPERFVALFEKCGRRPVAPYVGKIALKRLRRWLARKVSTAPQKPLRVN